jgi:hypothetical protein
MLGFFELFDAVDGFFLMFKFRFDNIIQASLDKAVYHSSSFDSLVNCGRRKFTTVNDFAFALSLLLLS